MNTYQFINSKDIRSYCEKKRHKFNSLETAFLIYQSRNHTVAEKHSYWNKLIETTPDMVIEKRLNCPHYDSLHEFLRQYMALENSLLNRFFAAEDDGVYRFDKRYFPTYYYFRENRYYQDRYIDYEIGSNLYADFAVGLNMENKETGEYADEFLYYRVTKFAVLSSDTQKPAEFSVLIDFKGNPLKVSVWNDKNWITDDQWDILFSFDGMWINVPTPFQKGDIVFTNLIYDGFRPDPFVLTEICTDNARNVRSRMKFGDTSDMTAYGYRILDDEGHIYYECDHDYLSLEYYKEPLLDSQQMLAPISLFIRKKISIEGLLDCYEFTAAKIRTNRLSSHCEQLFDLCQCIGGIE